jgi:hypothetical protein
MGFAGALRRSELVALDVAHLKLSDEGFVVTIAKSKTDQEGQGQTIAIPRVHGVRAHGNILAQAMSGSGIEVMMRCRRRIRDTGAQGHMGTRRIVVGNPRFQKSTVNVIPIVISTP